MRIANLDISPAQALSVLIFKQACQKEYENQPRLKVNNNDVTGLTDLALTKTSSLTAGMSNDPILPSGPHDNPSLSALRPAR